MDWLIRSVVELSEKKEYLKCLKRCGSLSRIMYAPEITETIAAIFSECKDVQINAQIDNLKSLHSLISQIKDDLPLKFHPVAFRASGICKPVWAG